ncbi:hypothetical protein FHL15_007994 [Xylaria flabelliformis]|uniref:Nephrocystin 3-like N-terminal domain-containing protein n=1 Tax=Xylaria flabelliformis TaxID=2512241 RepID=A0A553HST1_9PEZI|nr:hypothetical protein FHL15_007994 [Xylaria flabelliformis]
METLIERLGRSSQRREDAESHISRVLDAGATFGPASSVSSAQSNDPAFGADEDGQFGLFQLWPLKSEGFDVDETQVDIVAVHGLNGKAYKTWIDSGKLWLADFLPLDIPRARIFTYGYNSAVAFSSSASRVDDYARTLLERLMAKRRLFSHADKRPLLFICHSLGGVVVKRALVIAHERSRRYGSITQDTFGIMFLGTPHRGSDAAFWGKLFGSLANIVTLGSIRTQLLDDLKRKSDILGATCSQFVERSQSLHRIFSIYERVRVKGLSSLVVEEDSAIMGLPNEIPIPIEADHRSMCRFSSMQSEKYQMIVDCIKEMVEDALDQTQTETPIRDEFIRCIKTLDPDEILRTIARPSPGTCSWIIETSAFKEWRDRPDARFLWISGLPGVGKTTASRFLIEHLRRWLQRNPTITNKEPVVAFFFCASKQWPRNSEAELAKSLLYQLLSHSKLLFRYFSDADLQSYVSKFRDFLGKGDGPDEMDMAWKFLATILQRSPAFTFWILIDAIDELPEHSRSNILRRIQLLASQDLGEKLKFIICDRSGPSGRGITRRVSWLQIHQQDKLAEDVRHFVNTQLEELCSRGIIPWQYQNRIEESLVEISEGNFLQASLAWSHFRAGVTYWSPQVLKSRLEGLRRLSGEAKEFYCSLLERIPEDSREVAKAGFTWVLGSRKPLTLAELQHAVAISTGQNSWSDLEDSLGFNFDSRFDQAFGYLLRVDPDLCVRFAHTTVKELLTTENNMAPAKDSGILSKFLIREADVDAELAKKCIIVLSFRDFVKLRDIAREAMADRMKDMFVTALQTEEALQSLNFVKYDDPESAHAEDQQTSERIGQAILKLGRNNLDERTRSLFAYCVSYWNYHCNHGSSDLEVAKSLTNFALLRQSHYFLMVAMLLGMAKYHHGTIWDKVDQFSRLPPLHFVLRTGDHPNVLENLIKNGQDINGMDCHGWTPLIWALLEDRKESLELLLAHEETTFRPSDLYSDHILHIALEADVRPALVLRLLADPRVEVNARGSRSWTALQWCLSREHLQPVNDELLRRKDVDIYETNSHGLNAIEQVFNEGVSQQSALGIIARSDVPHNWFEKPLKLSPLSLLTDPLIVENVPGTFLYRAASLRWDFVEDLILQRAPSKAVMVDRNGLSLLERYAYHGMKQRLIRVLDKLPGYTLSMAKDLGAKLVTFCAQQDWEDVTNVLVHRFSAEDSGKDPDGKTIIHLACEFHWRSLPSFLGAKSKDWLNTASSDGRTALHVAAEYRNEAACTALLQAGASSHIRDKNGKFPVHLAAEQGHRAIVSLFLKSSMGNRSTLEIDNERRSILHYLVMWHSDSFIRQCLPSLQPRVDIRDNKGRSPAHFACIFGNNHALSVLMDIGADPNLRDSSSLTPLHCALKSGSAACAQTLVEHGARYDLLDKFDRNVILLATSSEDNRTVEYVVRLLESKLSSAEMRGYANHVDRFGCSALHYLCHWVDRPKLGDDDIGDVVMEELDEEWGDESSKIHAPSPVAWLIKTLATVGADVNGCDLHGHTPLHSAAMTGNLAAAQALLQVPDIHPSMKDKKGLTPLDWASVNRYDAMVEAIEEQAGTHSFDWQTRLRPLYQPWQSGLEEDESDGECGQTLLAIKY